MRLIHAHPALIDLVRERQGSVYENYSALRHAADHPRRMTDMLAQGVDPNSANNEGATILHQSDLPLSVVELVLAAGGDPDTPWYDRHGRTPLFFATTIGVPTALFRAGADLEARDVGGLTPLLFNLQMGEADMVAELLTLGADTDAHDDAGLDVWDYASLNPDATQAEHLREILRGHRRQHLQALASRGTVPTQRRL